MKFQIRKIKTEKEWNIILKLNSRLLKGCDYERHPKGTYWIIWHRKKPVGFFGVNEVDGLKGTMFFNRVGIAKGYQGKGLHKKSLQVRKNHCKRLGIKHLVTYTHIYNLRSANNLEAFGFRIYTPLERLKDKDMYYFHLFIK